MMLLRPAEPGSAAGQAGLSLTQHRWTDLFTYRLENDNRLELVVICFCSHLKACDRESGLHGTLKVSGR